MKELSWRDVAKWLVEETGSVGMPMQLKSGVLKEICQWHT